jgi:simple sugar transport system substrate-binding protein
MFDKLRMVLSGLVLGATVSAAAMGLATVDAAAQVKQASEVKITFITHGQANDVYWTVVKNGLLAAQKLTGAKVQYVAPTTFDVVKMGQLIDAAVATKPDGLVVSIPDATALEKPIKAAKAAGVPVVVIDSGEDQVKDWGLDLYVGGGDEYTNGTRAGLKFGSLGVKSAICVNHEVGNVSLDDRCRGLTDGLAKTGGKVAVVAVTMDPTDSTHRIEGYLAAHPETDAIMTLGPTVAAPVLKMLETRGIVSKFKFASFDLSPEVLEAISKGEMLFSVDSQQYLMGYYPVVFLVTKALYKTFPTANVYTGPALVGKDEAASVLALSKQGVR